MAEKLGEAILELTIDGQKYKYSLDKVEKDTRKSFKIMDGIVLGLGAKLVDLGKQGFQALIQYTKQSIQVAQNAQETYSKYDTIFGSMGTAADEMAERFATDFGLATSTAQTLLSATGDLLTGFGLAVPVAADLSEKTNALAVDLASFSNAAGGAEAVSKALTSAYTGEREALKTYGIVINEEMVKTEMLKQAQEGLTFESEQQAKIFATLALAQEQSENAIGDYARTADSAANVQRRLEEASIDLQEQIGSAFLPMVTKIRSKMAEWAGAIKEIIEESNNLRDARLAEEEGTATLEQQLLLLQEEKALLGDLGVTYKTTGLVSKENNDVLLKQGQAKIDAIDAEINVIAQRMRASNMEAGAARDAAEAKLKADEADAKRKKELSDYLTEVAKKYATTEQGKIDLLQAEIDKWEEYAETAVNTAPEVQAILENLNNEMAGLVGTTEDLGEAEDTTAQARKEYWDYWLGQISYTRDELYDLYIQGEISATQYTDALKLVKEETESLSISTEDLVDILTGGFESALSGFEDLGAALFEGSNAWVAFGKTALGALADVLRALGKELAAMSAVATVSALMGNVADIPAIAGGAAGASAAYIAAGLIDAWANSLTTAATGADFVTDGPQLLLVGENPGGREHVSVNPLSSPNLNGSGSGSYNITFNNLLSMGNEKEMREAAGKFSMYVKNDLVNKGEW